MGNRLKENAIRVVNFVFPEFRPKWSHGDPFHAPNDLNISSKLPKVARSSPDVPPTKKYTIIKCIQLKKVYN